MSTNGFVPVRAWHAARALAHRWWAAALPPVCCLCGAPGQPPDLDLCHVCETFLPFAAPRATLAGLAPAVAGDRAPARALSVFRYEYPVDHFIRALKFRGERSYARVLGMLMARVHRELGWALPVAIVPMPLHPARHRRRGFNQAWEIAKYAGAQLGVRVEGHALVRVVATREQSGLSVEERRRNVRGAFQVVEPLPAGAVALLDDVVTTGSTALAAARALRAAGVAEVELWSVARAERHGESRRRRRTARAPRYSA